MSLAVMIAILLVAMVVPAIMMAALSRRSPEGGFTEKFPTNLYVLTAGTMSLLISFTFGIAYGDYNDAQTATTSEAGAVMSMYRAAGFMEPELRDELRDDLMCYVELVSTIEWDSMAQGTSNLVVGAVPETTFAMDDLVTSPAGVKSAGVGLSAWESANDSRAQAHLTRMQAAEWSIPPIVWTLLIIGSLLTIFSLFAFADRSKSGLAHVPIVIGPMFIFTASLMVIAFFDHPYLATAGGVKPTAMANVKEFMMLEAAQSGRSPTPSCPTDTATNQVFQAKS